MKINVKTLILMSIFVSLMIVSAKISIPLPLPLPPITFQLFVAVASGIFLGALYGPIAMLSYIILGLIGFPIFSKGGGFAYILQPTFGFLIGFIGASWIVGLLWSESWLKRGMAIVLSVLACYIIGIPYFWALLNTAKPIAFISAVIMMLPFLAKDIVLGGVLFGFAQTMGRVAPDLMWRNKRTQTLS